MKKRIDITQTKYYKYAQSVVNGEIVACELVKQSCQRFLDDLQRDDLTFRADKVDRAITFIALLKHFKGKSNGKSFVLEPFQQFIVANLIGFYWSDNGYRRFTNAYIEMSRKGGKTALIAALAMYYFLADGEAGAEVDICANVKSQAYICFEFIEQFARQLDPKGKDLKPYRDSIVFKANNSKVNVFSSDDKGKDGFNASVGIIDEFHSARNTKMRDVIKSSMGQRQNPILLTITSAGFDKTLPCYKLRTTCTEILQGIKEDDSMFCIIFTLDDSDDWTDENVWIKSNPNLDKTVTKKYLREQVQSALNNPTEEVGVRTKNLGQWLSSSSIWLPDRDINAVTATVNIEDFKECECYVGVDLAAVSDMTAVSYLLKREDDPKLYFHTDYYLPESALVESPNRDLYRNWVRTGELKITEGNVTDYSLITNDIMRNGETVIIKKVGYDSYNATQWAITSTELGLPLEPYSQSIGHFNQPTREFERLVKSKMCVIDNNEITRWMFRNVAMKFDYNGNQKPNKGAGKDKKIDGVISMIEALGVRLDTPQFNGEIFSV